MEEIAGLPALIDQPSNDAGSALLLSHGANNDKSAPTLAALAQALASMGHLVIRFDLPYRAQGRKAPPAAERSVPGYMEFFDAAKQRFGCDVLAAGGKSYGGRVASLAAAEGMGASGLLFYGYPLHAPGKKEDPRVEHWPKIAVPSYFLQGTRDNFCDLEVLAHRLPMLGGKWEVEKIEGGDHSLNMRASKSPDGKARDGSQVLVELAPKISAWLGALS